MKRIAIVGGGITGLAAAFTLQQHGYSNFVLLEGSPRWGGKITSSEQGGFLTEGGPDSFLSRDRTVQDLCRKLGLGRFLIGSSEGRKATTYVWSRKHLYPMPEGMMLMTPTMLVPFLKSRLISWAGKLRMGLEPLIPARGGGDESLASFVRRRLGREALNKIAAPLMAGIHGADPERLSLRSTFPMFVEMERSHKSLVRAMMKKSQLAKSKGHVAVAGPMFASLRGGMQQLIEALLAELPPYALRTGCEVKKVFPERGRYRMELSDGEILLADEIVFATPASATAGMVQAASPLLAMRLRTIPYASTANVSLGFHRADIHHPMQGSGFLVPQTEGRRITACSWSSQKFDHRAPEDCVLLRVFIGGATAEALARQSDEALIAMARDELRTIMGIDAEPVMARACRWQKAMPQYEVGHATRVRQIELALETLPGLSIAGSSYYGAGIPSCIASGVHAAETVIGHIEESIPDFRREAVFAGKE
ncbi:protoporphyrinogen oxidase [Silvibacterium sp.]|uniref:protoporphyrinogen oxidase n=1 Tax=Silvibacterium sp. TaxID=1964179 RepID=UPI0039E543DA